MSNLKSISLRYFLLLILGLGNLFIFYLIFTPLTVYPVYFFVNLFHDATLLSGTHTYACEITSNSFLEPIACMNTTIFFKDYFASIIPACIAGSAYYLLLILNLTTPMSSKTRIKSIFFILGLFLLLNIGRIFTFAMLFVGSFQIFDLAHTASWYFGSTILVALIWFSNVIIFKIRTIPIYTDIKQIIANIRNK